MKDNIETCHIYILNSDKFTILKICVLFLKQFKLIIEIFEKKSWPKRNFYSVIDHEDDATLLPKLHAP